MSCLGENTNVSTFIKIQEKIEHHIINSSDTLSKIAKQYYGNTNKYPLIFKANREESKNADLIFHGNNIRNPKG